MAKLMIALLAVAVTQSFALKFRQENLCCTERPRHCWNHAYDGYEQTCAEMKCLGDGLIELVVTSPKEAHRVTLQSRLTPTNGGNVFPVHQAQQCQSNVEFFRDPATQTNPLPIQDDPFAQPAVQSELEDMNADYAAMLAAMGQGRSGTTDIQKSVTLIADSKECSPDGRGAFVKGDTGRCYSQGQLIVSVSEYLQVPDSPVDLLTVTYLFLDCGVSISEAPADYQPVLKNERAAQCQRSQYSLAAVANYATEQYNLEIKDDVHPDQDPFVGWQLKSLKYTNDLVIENHAPTVLGGHIQATIQNSLQADGVSAWTNNPAAYDVHSDIVTDPTSHQVTFSADINYCFNGAATELSGSNVDVCIATPTC